MEKPKRKLFVATLAPQDFEAIESRCEREARNRGEVLSLLIREAGLVREDKREEVTTHVR